MAGLPPELRDLSPERLNLLVNDLKNQVSGSFVSSAPDPVMVEAVNRYQNLRAIGNTALWIAVLSFAVGGIAYVLAAWIFAHTARPQSG